MELYVSPFHLSGILCRERVGGGYGFLVPRNARDMLISADKSLDG
jgi:hypothetical protein